MDVAATPVDPPSSEPASKPEKPDATVNENKFQQAIAAWRSGSLRIPWGLKLALTVAGQM